MPPLIVAAAIVRGGCLLAARRVGPPALAGLWELPGGKVEPGETPNAALHREIAEELGCRIELGDRIGADWPLPAGAVMQVWSARLTGGEPEPGPAHDELRWLPADRLAEVEWLAPDRPLLPLLAALLS